MLEIIPILVSLFIIEVLLSVDNALVNATIAEALPEQERKKAIRIGIILGAVFRLIALLFVAFIIQNVWIKVVGGAYLMYLAVKHLGKPIDSEGHSVLPKKDTYRAVIWQIAFADIVFSIDNVISAVSFSDKTWIVVLGVLIGMFSMLFITPILSKLIHKYKGMPQAAYTIVGFVGICLVLETLTHTHIGEFVKFLVILSIALFTVAYEHSLPLRKFSKPLLRSAQYLLALPTDILLLLTKKK